MNSIFIFIIRIALILLLSNGFPFIADVIEKNNKMSEKFKIIIGIVIILAFDVSISAIVFL